jgi:hypothetical protein
MELFKVNKIQTTNVTLEISDNVTVNMAQIPMTKDNYNNLVTVNTYNRGIGEMESKLH